MKATKTIHELAEPRIVNSAELRIAGLRGRFTTERRAEIPLQWQRFISEVRSASLPLRAIFYGVCYCSTGEHGFEYLSGIGVSDFSIVPASWSQVTLPAQLYAVFPHEGHVSKLAETAAKIEASWEPPAGYAAVPGGPARPDFFEHYGLGYDPGTGLGDIEIWVPLRRDVA